VSKAVDLDQLATVIGEYPFAFLVSVAEDASPHVLSVLPRFESGALVVDGVGRHTQANVGARGRATLVWPPTEPADFSLIVDGAATCDGSTLRIEPTSGIYHRPAVDADGTRTGSDCAPISSPTP
jgi:hypothetical protein